MAVYSIKNISASAVVWSSQTIQPNEAIDINYENLYDKTTDLGISQDAINVSTLAQEDKILLCIDDVASTKAETLEFIRELHNKNNVLEIPTKFLPSKHSYNWEKVGNKLSYLGDVDVDGNLNLGTNTNESPNVGDIWRDSNNVIKAVNNEGVGHDLWVGLGQVQGTSSGSSMNDANSLTINKFYRVGATWTGSPHSGTDGRNQGFLLHTGANSLYGIQTFYGQDGWANNAEIWTRTKSNGNWTPWIKSASTGVNNNFSVDQTFHGQIDVDGKTKIVQNGTALELHGTNHVYMAFHKTGGSRSAYFGYGSGVNDDITLMNETTDGKIKLGTNGVNRLTIASNGNVDIGGHNVVTESPYFTDGLVSYSSDITLSGFTGHSSLQYSVSKTGLLEFYGYCYTSSLGDQTSYQLNTGNPLPVNLRPKLDKYFSVQCWSSVQTRTLLLLVNTSGYIYLFTKDQGSGWSGTINIGMSFSYSLQ